MKAKPDYVVVNFSGGKDSTVLAYIAAKMMNGSPIPRTLHLLFCDTGLEYPEIRKFVFWYAEWLQKRFPRVKIDIQVRRPKKHFFDVIRDFGYPIIGKEVAKDIKEGRSGGAWATRRLNGEMKGSRFDHSHYEFLLYAPFLISHECCQFTKKTARKDISARTKAFANDSRNGT